MSRPTALGGFKILRPAALLALHGKDGAQQAPGAICGDLAREGINIVFLTAAFHADSFGASIGIQGDQADRASPVLNLPAGITSSGLIKSSIISLFPHRTRPEITGQLLEIINRKGLSPIALAQSASAISAAISEETTERLTEALFEPFSFGPYRTPEDWSLAQKGKEQLYKEVVASYQEKKPKVYGLDWQNSQAMLSIVMGGDGFAILSKAFDNLSAAGIPLTFLISTPSGFEDLLLFTFTVPAADNARDALLNLLPEGTRKWHGRTAVFYMNGPHFGDRYGIADQIFDTFTAAGINLLALSCSVASITGVLPSEDIYSATEALTNVFEIPCVTGIRECYK
ncbi:MAG: hypothetical protein C4582_06790 [Desulfobacteraceae bacterium]|nr:MAG: hypothetical protein C4582_06790 [Desulfobacteraceae bacterium]